MGVELSIVMPVRNTGAPLAEAIASVIAQTTTAALELVIVDDRSDDPLTTRLLSGAPAADARIRVIANTGPRGPGPARNAGIAAARGAWIAFLDSDDVWPAGSLQTRWARVADATNVEWLAGSYENWFPDGMRMRAGKPMLALVPDGAGEVLLRRPVEILAKYTPLMGTTLIRKETLDRIGGFDDRVFYGDDWWLNLKLAAGSDLLFMSAVVLHLRRHGLPTMVASDKYLMGCCDQAFPAALRYAPLAPYRKTLRRQLAHMLCEAAHDFAAKGRPAKALAARLRAIAALPTEAAVWRRVVADTLQLAPR